MIKDCHVGVKGIVCAEGEYLILRKGIGENAFWDIPGGRIDDAETLEQTLRRELSEELPHMQEYSVGELVDAYRLDRIFIDGRALVLIIYKIHAEKFDVTLSNEHDDFKWITKENLRSLLEPGITIAPQLFALLTRVIEKG